ncbi:T9SS type A sorting domain-containing protein, partial [Bacteroidota bacterium]
MLVSLICDAQTSTFEDNISNRNVYSMVIDRDYLWLGADGGIVKFNKQTEEFSNYSNLNDSSIQGYFGSRILSLAVNSSNELYATGDGVIYYNGNEWYRYTSQNSNLPFSGPSFIVIDNENKPWTNSGEYMCKLENDTFQNFLLPFTLGLSHFEVNECDFDSENNAWIGAAPGLFKIDNNQVKIIEEFEFERINTIKVMDDSILIGTKSNGMCVYYPDDGKIVEYDTASSGIKSNWVQYLHPDEDSFWIIAGGLMLFMNGHFTEYMDKDSVLNNLILNKVLPDGDVLWLATANKGLYKYDLITNTCEKKTISNLPFKSKIKPLSVDSIGTMYQLDSDNPAAIKITDVEGSSVKTDEDVDFFDQNYNSIYSSDTFNVFEKNKVLINFYQVDRTVVTYDSLWRPIISHIKEDRAAISNNSPQTGDFIKTDQNNTIYKTSSEGGYWQYNGTWTKFTKDNSAIPTFSVSNLCFDNSGKLWLSAQPEVTDNPEIIPGALMSFEGTEHKAISIPDIPDVSDNSAFISCIYIDSSNVLWMGISDLWSNGVSHGNGLFSFDGDSWINYTIDNSGLSSNTINCINAHKNKLYIGTSGGGMSIFDPADETWKTYTTENSLLPWNTIHSIDFDNSDSMYIYHDWNDNLKTGLDIEVSQRNLEIKSSKDDFIVYPNPTNDMLTIKTSEESPMVLKKICIYDITGKLLAIVNSTSNQNNLIRISLNELSLTDGMYLIELVTDRRSYVSNIILQN